LQRREERHSAIMKRRDVGSGRNGQHGEGDAGERIVSDESGDRDLAL
jgi:hypothetical protein